MTSLSPVEINANADEQNRPDVTIPASFTSSASVTPPAVAAGMANKSSGKPAKLIMLGMIAMFAVVLLAGATPRVMRHLELDRTHKDLASAIPELKAVLAKREDARTTLLLPGDIQPVQNIPLYARANGYLVKRYVDIGDNVKAGQLLAVIDTPELDQQVEQAKANLRVAEANLTSTLSDKRNFEAQLQAADATIKQAETNLDFSTIELKRFQRLSAEGAVSFEQRDQALKQCNSDTAAIQITENNKKSLVAQIATADAKINAAKQSVSANQASVKQLQALQAFQKVVAPADGVITNRFVDAGSLVAAGGNNGTTELLSMAKTDVLRIYVDVPQTDYRYIHTGDHADILLQEFPGQPFSGKVTNISGTLSSNSRTLQTELRIDNPTHILKPGSYADVRFVYNNQMPPVVIPSNGVITKNDGLYVAVLEGKKIHYRHVEVSRDYGNKVAIFKGLKPNDVVLLDPPDGLAEGSIVKSTMSHA